jgi:PAS domain S-box-containing protein
MATTTNPKILIVEDEGIAEDIRDSLDRLGYRNTFMANTGARALEITTKERPDLILMDIKLMGPMDGIETADRIRVTSRTPVVYLSVNIDQATLERARLTEPFGYVLKPFRENELQITIEMALVKSAREKLLRQSERWLASTLHDIGAAVITTDTGGAVTFMNPIAERLTGYVSNEALGTSFERFFQIFDEETHAALPSPVAAALRHGGPVDLPPYTVLRTRSGDQLSLDTSAAPIRDEAGNFTGVVIVFRDLTIKHQVEEHIRESQKMAAIGRLAGGISHHFNNLLTAILGYSELILTDSQDEVARKYAGEIKLAGERAAVLTGQMLTISQNQLIYPQLFDLGQLTKDMAPPLWQLLNGDIDFVIQTGDGPSLILADRSQVEQVLTSLVANARDAMPEGGRLTVETGSLTLHEALNDWSASVAPGEYVVLTVTDTGCGMDSNTMAQIFDPFFTTKERGKGAGLGLATAYGVLRRNQAEISVESSPGAGAVFRIYFPRQLAVAAPRVVGVAQSFLAGSGAVLVGALTN